MKELIEKWKPMMEYKFNDGLSVPEDKYLECAEKLDMFEKMYKEDAPEMLKFILSTCLKEYSQGKENFNGGINEFIKDNFRL